MVTTCWPRSNLTSDASQRVSWAEVSTTQGLRSDSALETESRVDQCQCECECFLWTELGRHTLQHVDVIHPVSPDGNPVRQWLGHIGRLLNNINTTASNHSERRRNHQEVRGRSDESWRWHVKWGGKPCDHFTPAVNIEHLHAAFSPPRSLGATSCQHWQASLCWHAPLWDSSRPSLMPPA